MKRLGTVLGGITALSAAVGATCAVIATWRGRQRWISVDSLFDDEQLDEPTVWEPRRGDRRPGFRASTALDTGMCTGFTPPGLTVLKLRPRSALRLVSSRKEHRACGPLEPLGAPPARGAHLLPQRNDYADPSWWVVSHLNIMYRELAPNSARTHDCRRSTKSWHSGPPPEPSSSRRRCSSAGRRSSHE